MTVNEISGFLSAKLCISVFLIVGLLGTGAAQSYDNLYRSNAPQTALDVTDLYKALQNPYTFKDPQAGLENANTYKELQKLNGIYYSSRVEDNWYYWTNMWLNGPQEATGTNVANIYGTMSNPYAFKDPQAALEDANTYKQLQKLNGIYTSSRSVDNWYYWTNTWLNEPST